MNTRRVALALAAGATLTLAACGSDAKSTSTTAASATTAAAAAPTTAAASGASTTAGSPSTVAGPAAAADTVTIGDFKFGPADLKVAVGATVTFVNAHTQPHTATSAGNFDTGSIAPGESKTITFDTAGNLSYICSFHPFMTGTVTVG